MTDAHKMIIYNFPCKHTHAIKYISHGRRLEAPSVTNGIEPTVVQSSTIITLWPRPRGLLRELTDEHNDLQKCYIPFNTLFLKGGSTTGWSREEVGKKMVGEYVVEVAVHTVCSAERYTLGYLGDVQLFLRCVFSVQHIRMFHNLIRQ